MSFSLYLHTLFLSKQHISKQQQSLRFSSVTVHKCKNKYREKLRKTWAKRASVPAFRQAGILTIEAAVCITFFLLAALSLMGLFQTTEAFLKKQQQLVGLARTQSVYIRLQDTVHLDVSYPFKPSFLMLAHTAIPLHHEVYIKSWNGYKPKRRSEDHTENKKIYYVTDFESVYHTTRNCTHLNLSVSMADKASAFGDGYAPCEKCGMHTNVSGNYYVTEEGRRYHASLSCPGLKRTIRTVTEIFGLSPCGRCG